MIIFEALDQALLIARLVVVHDILGVLRVDIGDVLRELAALLWLYFLKAFETAGLNESSARLDVFRQHLGKLRAHISEDVRGSRLNKRIQRRQYCAYLQNVFESSLGFFFEVWRAVGVHVDGQET